MSDRDRHPGRGSTEDRLVLPAALVEVPPRQRAVPVLRYREDLSVQGTARALGCSEGTVNSQAARGLRTLRGPITPRQGEKAR